MKSLTEVLTAGSPRFEDPTLAALAKREGASAAWQHALSRPAHEVAAVARGHFAVGLQDVDGLTFLAVDRFATHTLCYREQGGSLRFSERADELAEDPHDLDPQALLDYLYFHAIPSPRTVFRDVKRLAPGHFAWDGNGTAVVARYWTPSFVEQSMPFTAAREQFMALLRQAVAAQLDDSPPACFLSGGTDSSTVAGLIREVTGKAPATYSIGFDAEGYDEMAYARIAAKRFGTEHHEIYIKPADLVRHIPELAAHHDQPFGNSSALPTYFCALKACQDGVTRLLAGDGGDELFGGNLRYAKQRVLSWYEQLPYTLRTRVLQPISKGDALARIPILRKAAGYVRQAQIPMPDRLQTYNLLNRLGHDSVLTPAFLAMVDITDPQVQERAVWQESQGASFVNRMLAFDWRYTLAENDIPKVRSSTELAGVSVGYPFLDQAIVEFSEHLATAYKLKGLKLRWFFKEALRGFLPDEIIAKKKHGFGLPFGVWATRDPALKALARDSVRGLGARGIVRQEFAEALVDKRLPEHPGYYGEMVWILMMLEQWFRHHAPDYTVPA